MEMANFEVSKTASKFTFRDIGVTKVFFCVSSIAKVHFEQIKLGESDLEQVE